VQAELRLMSWANVTPDASFPALFPRLPDPMACFVTRQLPMGSPTSQVCNLCAKTVATVAVWSAGLYDFAMVRVVSPQRCRHPSPRK
jgi:hypothetical protein